MLDINRIEAEIAKLAAETVKLNRDHFWYPIAVAAGLIGAGAALAAGLLAVAKLVL